MSDGNFYRLRRTITGTTERPDEPDIVPERPDVSFLSGRTVRLVKRVSHVTISEVGPELAGQGTNERNGRVFDLIK